MEFAARHSVISIVNENGKPTRRKEMKTLCERKDALVAGTRVALHNCKKDFP
jgi:hypothetical protein